jgi:hypothetical protein
VNPVALLSLFSRKIEQITVTFNSNTAWVAPVGVNMLTSVVGRGGTGTPSGTASTYVEVSIIEYTPFGTGPAGGNLRWEDVQGYSASVASDVNADGVATFSQGYAEVWPDGSNVANSFAASITDAIPGTASVSSRGGWSSSGAITADGTEGVSYDYATPSTTGAVSTGFGKTFPGGVGGAGTPVTHNSVVVTPGSTYNIVVAAGGAVQITYNA